MTAPRLTPTEIAAFRPASGRWSFARKAQVVLALERGQAEPSAVCAALDLSAEELATWRARWRQGGFGALRVTRTQQYRAAGASGASAEPRP